MNRSSLAFTIALGLLFSTGSAPANGQSCGRKTLLQWSYGTSFSGGPDLDAPLVTDRPDFTESPVTVGYRVAQIESGYTYTYDSDAGGSTRSHSYPETLLRVGALADWFEFRFDWNYLDERTADFGAGRNSASGAEDLGIGCKIALTPQERVLPETAVILQSTVPSGASEFTAEEMLPGISFLYAWEINDKWTTGGLSAVNRATDDVTDDSYLELSQSWTVVHSWNECIDSYTEWFVLAPSSADTNHTEHYFNGGFAVLLSDDLQWDVRAGLGLNEAAADFFAGTGLSIRFR